MLDLFVSKIGHLLSVGLCGLPIVGCANEAEVTVPPVDTQLELKLPTGFKANVYARLSAAGSDYFRGPRFMTFGPDGNLYLAMGMDNKVIMLPDHNHDGVADEIVLVADHLNAPNGLVFNDGKLLVANQDGVVVLETSDQKWPASKILPFISGLPSGGHAMKTIRMGPDGYLYLNVGSSCNVCIESDPMRATILRYDSQGKPAGSVVTVGRHVASPIWAYGLRNSQDFAWHPQTGAMFATNDGADMRSGVKGGVINDEVPPEHLNRIEAGKHYGWPYCWGVQQTDPNFTGPDGFCAETQAPEITFPSHSTPIGITFLDKSNFPTEYKSDAIVALHGSWNRKTPSGYKLVRVKFNQDKPVEVIDFATGWLNNQGAWGRPVGLQVGPDGALYVSDDRAGMIYRITYQQIGH